MPIKPIGDEPEHLPGLRYDDDWNFHTGIRKHPCALSVGEDAHSTCLQGPGGEVRAMGSCAR